jgi:antitoxin component YwqK of YwqJK toxin-antitoxin module
MTIEQRLDQLEKRNKRLTVALTMMAVAMAAVVTMAATGEKRGDFDTVVAQYIGVKNDAGDIVVVLGADDDGHGLVRTRSAKGKDLVNLTSTENGQGTVTTYQPNGKMLVRLGTTSGDQGEVTTFQPNGKTLVKLNGTDNGGMITVYNKTGDGISQMYADEYGNGLVCVYDRKGDEQTLKPGP